ncbi:MFS transporter, partial [Legionella pneumophila]|nr:MFS transporter [Legionella pneumophila]
LNAITTFSFAILFSSLSLYLTKNIGLTQMQSNGIVGFFLASNFILHFVAGYIGDRFLSYRLLLVKI